MESSKKDTVINIGSNSGTVNSTTNGNIQSINNVNHNDNSKEISDLVNSLKDLISKESFEEGKEEILDDLESVEEQINSKQPKKVKLKKAYQGIKSFIAKAPKELANVTLIITRLNELNNLIQSFI